MDDNGFLISEINGKYNNLLKKTDYMELGRCKTIEEIILILNKNFRLQEGLDVKDLKKELYRQLHRELDEVPDKKYQFMKYLRDTRKINAFFSTLETGSRDKEIDYIDDLQPLSTCSSFREAFSVCIEDTELEKYFANVPRSMKDENIGKIYMMVVKNCMDFYAKTIKDSFMIEIMKAEGDRMVYEICCGPNEGSERKKYFPFLTGIDDSLKKKLEECKSEDEIRDIFKSRDENPIDTILRNLITTYALSFKEFDDPSCIYAYFKLKEREISNIMWITECTRQNLQSEIGTIWAPE